MKRNSKTLARHRGNRIGGACMSCKEKQHLCAKKLKHFSTSLRISCPVNPAQDRSTSRILLLFHSQIILEWNVCMCCCFVVVVVFKTNILINNKKTIYLFWCLIIWKCSSEGWGVHSFTRATEDFNLQNQQPPLAGLRMPSSLLPKSTNAYTQLASQWTAVIRKPTGPKQKNTGVVGKVIHTLTCHPNFFSFTSIWEGWTEDTHNVAYTCEKKRRIKQHWAAVTRNCSWVVTAIPHLTACRKPKFLYQLTPSSPGSSVIFHMQISPLDVLSHL